MAHRKRSRQIDPDAEYYIPLSWRTVLNILAKRRHGEYDRPLPPDFYGPGLPCQRTDALPGSPEKVAVMEERYENREKLFNPRDAKIPN